MSEPVVVRSPREGRSRDRDGGARFADDRAGEASEDVEPPDFGKMAAALERNGVHVITPEAAAR